MTSSIRLAASHGDLIVEDPFPRVAPPPSSGVSSPLNMDDTIHVLGMWHAWMSASYAPKTVTMYWQVAFRYLSDVTIPLDEHTENDVATWLEHFPYRSSARRSYYNALLCLFGWAARNGHTKTNIVRDIRVPAPVEKVPRALTVEQLEAVRTAAYKRAPVRGYALDLLYFSAARCNEVLNLTWEDVTDEGLVLRVTKTGNERLIPWCDGLRHAVEGLRQHFGEQTKIIPRSQQTVWLWVRTAGEEAGVKDVHPHLFRSTAATRALVKGARPHAVRSLLGHSKMQTTTRYWAVESEDVQEAVNLL